MNKVRAPDGIRGDCPDTHARQHGLSTCVQSAETPISSHYFLDDAYLNSRLVVPMPDDARVIADFANQAILEREQIIRAYQAYAPGYNRRAQQVLAEFLEFPLDNS